VDGYTASIMEKRDPTKSDEPQRLRFETLAIHAGQRSDPENGAVMTPVYFSSTFEQDSPARPRGGYEYSRTSNPTRTALQDNLAALEGGRWGLAFASGLAATNALCHRLRPGDHVLATNDLYGGTFRLFRRCFEHYGIAFDFVPVSDASAVERALRANTRYLFLESPTNPLLTICDLARLSAVAKRRGVLTIVDNTFATPFLQRPLELGADVVLHSLTKYIGGHSDVVAGALIGNDEELRKELAFYQNAVGGQLGPMDAFLVLRGVKTLPLRMERHCANAQRIAEALAQHPLVEKVFYPGLASHPQRELAARQMRGFGGMVSFELHGGIPAANAFASATELFTLAESLGGVESLVEVPASMTHASIPAEERRRAGLSDGLVRLSVGVEHVDDLLADVQQAIERSAIPARLAAR
jgi:cystathionine beta-lyase/cystathionine gamma-synthase